MTKRRAGKMNDTARRFVTGHRGKTEHGRSSVVASTDVGQVYARRDGPGGFPLLI